MNGITFYFNEFSLRVLQLRFPILLYYEQRTKRYTSIISTLLSLSVIVGCISFMNFYHKNHSVIGY